VNLGNPEEFTIRELAERVVKAVGGSARVELARPLPQDDPAQRCPDIRLAQRVLGWQPRVTLAEGLPRTVEWFKQIDMTKFRAPTPNY
jgi:UDP-glucuronate decarboxylase